jgi:hypothetical protein
MEKKKAYEEVSDASGDKDDQGDESDGIELDAGGSNESNPIQQYSDEHLQSLTSHPTFEACLHLCKQAKVHSLH